MQLLNLLFGIFLSRMLMPSDYGMTGALTVFAAMAGTLAESGFILAIVNKKEVKHEDYNAVFWFSICMGALLYGVLFACAPLIAQFYHTPSLTPLARFLFLSFFMGSISTVPVACFFRNLMVKERSQIQIIAILISGTAGITCAYHGLGAWGIALQTVLYSGINTLLNWHFSPWRPTFSFHWQPLRGMLPFSSKLLFTAMFTQVSNNIFSLLLGHFYTLRQVGYYTQGNKWTIMGCSTILGMINNVGQPVFREASEDRLRLQNIFHKLLRFTAFVSFPAMLGLAAVSEELIVLSITDKWLPCVPVMQILCVWGAFVPVATLYANLMNSLGHPDIYMWNTIGLGLFQLVCLGISYSHGLHAMLSVYAAVNILWLLVWHHFAYRHAGILLSDVLKDIAPYLALSALAVGAACAVASLTENLYLSLLLKIVSAAALYLLCMWRLKSQVFRESLQYLFKKGNIQA